MKQNMQELSLAPYGDGRFEVFVDDDCLYSKLQTGEFPDNATIVAKVKKRA
jgi:selT/selW/selH-like putative selenoprotein